MPAQSETQLEAALDLCIDELLAGNDWLLVLPVDAAQRRELSALMEVARQLVRVAAATAPIHAAQRARIWRRVEERSFKGNWLKAIAFYRLPYLPPLWIRPEAC